MGLLLEVPVVQVMGPFSKASSPMRLRRRART